MSSTKVRIASLLGAVALVAGITTIGQLASAEAGGPTVILASSSATSTSATSIPVTATFSEPVNGFGASSVSATNATVTDFSGSGADYSFNLSPTANGTTTVQIPADSATSTASSTGNQISNTLTFLSEMNIPTTTPVISNVIAADTGPTSETITWTTDTPASSQVFYGTSSMYGSSSALDSTAITSHSVMITGLTEATLYHYQVASTNANGTATSTDQVFVTESTGSSTPLAVTGIDSLSSTATADGTFANGFKWVLHFVVPSVEKFFSLKFADFTTPSSSSTIPIAGNVRYFSPQSSNAADEGSAVLESNNDYGGALILTGDTSATTPGRQIDVTVETAVPTGTLTGVYSTIFGALSTTSATSTP